MIKASECKNCKRRIIPSRDTCPYCGADDSVDVDLSENGTILSYTVLQMPPEGFEPPVLLGLVELDGGAVTLCLGSTESIGKVTMGSEVLVNQDSEGRFLFMLKK